LYDRETNDNAAKNINHKKLKAESLPAGRQAQSLKLLYYLML
jgi:hypothetical protein